MWIEFAISTVVACIVWFLWDNYKNISSNEPPGPIRFPLIGSIPQLLLAHKDTYLGIHKLTRKYGKLMTLKLGGVNSIVIGSYEDVKEILNKEETLNRPCEGLWADWNLKQNIGITLANGLQWTNMRKYCRESLRHYGFGSREASQELITEELIELVKFMDMQRIEGNGLIHFDTTYFNLSFTNLTASLVIGKRFLYEDAELLKLLDYQSLFMENSKKLGVGLMTAFPFLIKIFPELLGYNAQMKAIDGIQEVAKGLLESRRKEPYDTNPRCFTDEFLIEIDKDALNSEPSFTEDQFKVVFFNLVQGGIDTTSYVVNFILLHLVSNQSIQEKVYAEIVNACGFDRYPTVEDKAKMTYTQAVIWEGLRWARVVANGVPKQISKDFIYKGFLFKKDTILLMDYHGIYFNEAFWKDPAIFRPDRFLDENNKLIPSAVERVLTFGSGKRDCFGQVLARDSLFFYITTLVQKFSFKFPTGYQANLEPLVGFLLGPHPYEAIVSLRNPYVN